MTTSLPPGPRTLPPLQLLQWIRAPFPWLDACVRRYGDAFTLRLGPLGPMAFFSSPEAIKQIFTGDPDVLRSGEALSDMEPLLGGASVLLLDGAAHLRQRRLLMPPFHGERMQAYADVMREATDEAIDAWPVGAPFALHPGMQHVTLEVILRAVFGLERGAAMRELGAMITRLIDRAQTAWILLRPLRVGGAVRATPWGEFLALRAQTDALIYAEIARRRAEASAAAPGAARTDVLSLLLAARDEDGSAMTDAELRDELITLLLAGHETSASSLAWVFDRLLHHPAVLARVREELARVVGEGPVTAAHVARLEYLDAVIKETLRLHPILPLVARRVRAPVEIGGYVLPPGVSAAASIYTAQRRAASWPGGDPTSFRPERFVGIKPDPYAYLPFGGGARRCIGMAFAMYEMKVVLATVLSRAALHATAPPARTVRRGITLVPEGGARVVLEARAPRGAALAPRPPAQAARDGVPAAP